MVNLQSQAVEDAVKVFEEMQTCLKKLVEGLKDIAVSIECADCERKETIAAVKSISDIIEETADSAESVTKVAEKLLCNVENLSRTAQTLSENMDGLKNEISVFTM